MGKQYSDSVRSAVLDRYKDGEPVTSIAASTSIARSTIYTWINLSKTIMRISEPFKLNKGVQVVKLFHFSFRF